MTCERLENESSSRKGEVLITMFRRPNGETLSAVPRSKVAKFHLSEVPESKILEALRFTKQAADKAVAHLSLGPPQQDDEDIRLYQISCLTIRSAVEHCLYGELGLPFPPLALEEIEPEYKNRNEVLGARVNLHMAAKKWDMRLPVIW